MGDALKPWPGSSGVGPAEVPPVQPGAYHGTVRRISDDVAQRIAVYLRAPREGEAHALLLVHRQLASTPAVEPRAWWLRWLDQEYTDWAAEAQEGGEPDGAYLAMLNWLRTQVVGEAAEHSGYCRAQHPEVAWARCCLDPGHKGRHAITQEGLFWDNEQELQPWVDHTLADGTKVAAKRPWPGYGNRKPKGG